MDQHFLQGVYKSLSGRLLINSQAHKKKLIQSLTHTQRKHLSQGNIKALHKTLQKINTFSTLWKKGSTALEVCCLCFWSSSVLFILLQERMGEWSLDFQPRLDDASWRVCDPTLTLKRSLKLNFSQINCLTTNTSKLSSFSLKCLKHMIKSKALINDKIKDYAKWQHKMLKYSPTVYKQQLG